MTSPRAMSKRTTPTTTAILDSLHRLHTACALGHFNRPDGSRGRTEFELAMLEARRVLQTSTRYGKAMTD